MNPGGLDAPDLLKPTYDLCTVRREAWLPPFPLTRLFDRVDKREAALRNLRPAGVLVGAPALLRSKQRGPKPTSDRRDLAKSEMDAAP